MKLKDFLQTISPYVIVNMGFIKRLFPESGIKELRETIRTAVESEFLVVHDYPELKCYSLSKNGFSQLNINHTPRLSLTEHQVDIICRTNHLRHGLETSTQAMNIHSKWTTGAKFASSPLFIRINNSEQEIKPVGAMVITDKQAHQKLIIIHEFNELDSFQSEMNLYQIYMERELHLKRFRLNDRVRMRVIVLVPSYKTVLQFHKRLKAEIYQNVIFLPLSHVHHDELLTQPVFMTSKAEKVSFLRKDK